MYVHPGDVVKAGEELFNVSIMKQEKAVLAPVDGIVKRVLKTADFKESKQMVSVREGELIVELGPVPRLCSNEACGQPIPWNMRHSALTADRAWARHCRDAWESVDSFLIAVYHYCSCNASLSRQTGGSHG